MFKQNGCQINMLLLHENLMHWNECHGNVHLVSDQAAHEMFSNIFTML